MKQSIQQLKDNTNIGNWRSQPYSRWSFQHVDRLIPVATVPAAKNSTALIEAIEEDLMTLDVFCPEGTYKPEQLFQRADADSVLILHKGKKVLNWRAQSTDSSQPHIVFSISKSITAMLTGILADQGKIDCEAPIVDYLPKAVDSVYADATLRHLLDMTIALDFEENYADPESEYMRYRMATAWNPVDPDHPGPDLEAFLYKLSKANFPHGKQFTYRSPNSDMLGLALERATGKSYSTLMSENLWQPMGAVTDAMITLDRQGAPRSAGGICVTIDDLARLGELFLSQGRANGRQVIPDWWINDTVHNGDQGVWDAGDFKQKLPDWRYRNNWYLSNDKDGVIAGRGIHGQFLYINPKRDVVAVKLASQNAPLDDAISQSILKTFNLIAETLSDN